MRLSFLVCVSDTSVLDTVLLSSPCVKPGSPHQLILAYGCQSAAEGYDWGMTLATGDILVFVHQDVFLPAGWDRRFIDGFMRARELMQAEVVGVYGLTGATDRQGPLKLGTVNDRGEWLRGTIVLPSRAQSLDELLIAVPRGSRLRPDPKLGFDLYATDLVLQAESNGGCGAVVEAPCEHRSSLPRDRVPRLILERFTRAALVFEQKWSPRFPIETPCMRFDAGRPVADTVSELQTWIDNHD